MGSSPVSRRIRDIPCASTRIPSKSASPRNPDPARGGNDCRSDGDKIVRNRSMSFFLTPPELNHPSSRVPLNPALETGFGPKAREAVQLAEHSLDFHKSQDSIPFSPNVSSFQRAFTVNKDLFFTHRKRRRPIFCSGAFTFTTHLRYGSIRK